MPSPLLSRYQQNGHFRPALILPLAYLLSSLLAGIWTPVQHSLLTSAAAWLSIWAYTTWRVGAKSWLDAVPAQKLAWGAGGLFALARIEETAVDGRGTWWAKALLPLLIFVIHDPAVFGNAGAGHALGSPVKQGSAPSSTSRTPLLLLTASAIAASYVSGGSNTVMALAFSYAVVTAVALLLVQRAGAESRYPGHHGGSVIYSANGLLSQPERPASSEEDAPVAVLRDVSAAAAVGTGIAALLESFDMAETTRWSVMTTAIGDAPSFGQGVVVFLSAVGMITFHAIMNGTLLMLIQNQDVLLTSLLPLSTAVTSQLVLTFSLSRLWFAALSIVAGLPICFPDRSVFSSGSRTGARAGKVLALLTITSLLLLLISYFPREVQPEPESTPVEDAPLAPPRESYGPLQYTNPRVHPVEQLMHEASASWASTLKTQSRSLDSAVVEYKRRYGIPPPPNFDKWYDFARRKGVQLIDEYDTIYHSLLPFWGLPPATIRARTREALGYDNHLMAMLIRDGKVVHVEGGQEWLEKAAAGMMEQFVQYLPSMDLAFNIHDEPRVVVPHDELSRLVEIAAGENMPAALRHPNPKNSFSPKPRDVKGNKRIDEIKTTRFNVFAHQPTWIPSRMSCSPDSPARGLHGLSAADNMTAYALADLGFVYNHTAFSDVCNSPSFSSSFGFFDRPNAYNVVHELFPIFSQSKISSFQDILYPSPWYWDGKVTYDEARDMDWDAKTDSLWWRGTTTGGFSREGGWRRQHRQQIVRKLNAPGTAQILTDANRARAGAAPAWTTQEVPRQDYKRIMDVRFSGVGQCDPGDCEAQREFFDIAEPADQQDAWRYRYLLDMDGNAFSGRFYAFLRSHSLTLKMAVFREWHEEWIKPWVHYIPLSLRADEGLETVRYLSAEAEGQQQALRMAAASRKWAGKALRNEDFEVWFFRLLLEYGRVIDDNRATIGYSRP